MRRWAIPAARMRPGRPKPRQQPAPRFATYLKVAGWAVVIWAGGSIVLGLLLATAGVGQAGDAVSGLLAFAVGLWLGGRRYRLATVSQWAIATGVSIGLLLLVAFALVSLY